MRNLTLAAALLMASTSVLAQTAQPTTSAAGATATMSGEATTSATAPTANSPVADPNAEASVTGAAETTTAATVPAADPAPTAADTAAAASIGGGASASAAPAVAVTTTASADWSSFDGDKDGALTPPEFAMHADAANSELTAEAKRERFSRASGNGAIKLLNATADDFSKADANQDRKVDSTELAAWQSGGASASAAPAVTTVTSGAGEMTPIPEATSDAAAPEAAPADASDVPEGQQADDTMATDTPPKN